MVITCTIRALLKKNEWSKNSLSLGKVLCLRPFSVTYPCDKASQFAFASCVWIQSYYLNAWKGKLKRIVQSLDIPFQDSYGSCPCNKSPNGYYQWKCVNEKCENCPDHQTKVLKYKNDHEKQVKSGQFETITTMYTKNNKPKKSTYHNWTC